MTGPRQNEYFIPGDGISREVIQADICRYLGNDALVRPGNHNVRFPLPFFFCCSCSPLHHTIYFCFFWAGSHRRLENYSRIPLLTFVNRAVLATSFVATAI